MFASAISDPGLGRAARLGLHLVALVVILLLAMALATWRGGLWPFDPRFSALIAAGGIAVLAIAWWPAALAIGGLSALLPRLIWRLALWPLAIAAMIALHAAFGPRLGFLPLSALGPAGAVLLYLTPTAVPILLGSALRNLVKRSPSVAASQTPTLYSKG